MNDLKFNIYGFTKPATPAEYSQLLIEALLMADELSEMINANEKFLEKHVPPRAT